MIDRQSWQAMKMHISIPRAKGMPAGADRMPARQRRRWSSINDDFDKTSAMVWYSAGCHRVATTLLGRSAIKRGGRPAAEHVSAPHGDCLTPHREIILALELSSAWRTPDNADIRCSCEVRRVRYGHVLVESEFAHHPEFRRGDMPGAKANAAASKNSAISVRLPELFAYVNRRKARQARYFPTRDWSSHFTSLSRPIVHSGRLIRTLRVRFDPDQRAQPVATLAIGGDSACGVMLSAEAGATCNITTFPFASRRAARPKFRARP